MANTGDKAQPVNTTANRIAEALTNIDTFLASTAQTDDYFQGYSLSSAIQQRLDTIGKLAADSSKSSGTTNSSTAPKSATGSPKTQQDELTKLLEDGLSAIEEARSIFVTKDKYDVPNAVSEYLEDGPDGIIEFTEVA